MEFLPVKYRIEFYENSLIDHPINSITTSSVPFTLSVGDKVEPRAWAENPLPSNMIYEVKEVTHLFMKIADSHVVHSLSVVLVAVNRPN